MITNEKAEQAKDPAAPIAQVLSIAGGAKLAEMSIGLAVTGLGEKQRRWMEQRGRLDEGTARALDARIAADRARTASTAREVVSLAAIPTREAGGMGIGGQVTKAGVPQSGLVVSLVDRSGKAMDCGKTNGAGLYKLRNTKGAECLVLVSTAAGTRRLKLDDRPIAYLDGGAVVRNIELADQQVCPDGPDTSNRAVMPEVIGRNLEEAKAELDKHKIKLTAVRTAEQVGGKGQVIASDPPSGRLLGENPSAVLTIALERDPKATPEAQGDVAPAAAAPPPPGTGPKAGGKAAKPRTKD